VDNRASFRLVLLLPSSYASLRSVPLGLRPVIYQFSRARRQLRLYELVRNIRLVRSTESTISNCANAARRKGNALLSAAAIIYPLSVSTALLCNASTIEAQTPSSHSSQQERQTSTKPPASTATSTIKFENVLKVSGINFSLKNSISPQRYSIETMTGGVALFDYNNDGLLDIFFYEWCRDSFT
jgi:hypothetical protein